MSITVPLRMSRGSTTAPPPPPPPHTGGVDVVLPSVSYTHTRNLFPHDSLVLPVHGEQQSAVVAGTMAVAFVLPQKQPYDASTPASRKPAARHAAEHTLPRMQ